MQDIWEYKREQTVKPLPLPIKGGKMIWIAGGVLLMHQAVTLMVMRMGMEIEENAVLPWVFYILACAVAAVMFVWGRGKYKAAGIWGMVFLGSIASNVYERVVFGGVADWFWVGDWVVNSADVGIVVGLILWGLRVRTDK